MISDNRSFDTNSFFSGGAGMFLQYHDVIKPVSMYAVIQMILTNQSYGLPIEIVKGMSIISIIEWYVNRRFKNPLKQLDFANRLNTSDLDNLLHQITSSDNSIYRIAPILNVGKMIQVYKSQHMQFPIYIYSEVEDPFIREDCDKIFHGITHRYFFGDIKSAILNCDQNFTYIFSDIELLKTVADILIGTCSHLLVARDYRYNYTDAHKTMKYDLTDMAATHPFLRIGTTIAMNPKEVAESYAKLLVQEDSLS